MARPPRSGRARTKSAASRTRPKPAATSPAATARAATSPAATAPLPADEPPVRRTGIVVLAIGSAIAGVLGVPIALLFLAASTTPSHFVNPDMAAWGAIFGSFYLAISIGAVVFAYGAWRLRRWAWRAGSGLALAWGALNVFLVTPVSFSASLGGVVIGALILYYLYRPGVRAAFAL